MERFPRSNLPPKYKQTSCKWLLEAIIKAVIKLSLASLRISHKGICEPVNTTGLFKFSNIKDSAEAV